MHVSSHNYYITGCRVQCYGSKGGSVQVYPYCESNPSGPPRTQKGTDEAAIKAISSPGSEVYSIDQYSTRLSLMLAS